MKRIAILAVLLASCSSSSEVVIDDGVDSGNKYTISKSVSRSADFAEAIIISGYEDGHDRSIVIFDCNKILYSEKSSEYVGYYDGRYVERGGTEWTNAAVGSSIYKALEYACFDILPSE
jgi:hypothetical protein